MNLFYKKIYSIICRIYAEIFSLLENLFFKSNLKFKSILDEDGFLKIPNSSDLSISKKRFDFLSNEIKE